MEAMMTILMMVSVVGIIHTISSFPFIITFTFSFIMSCLLTYSSVVNKAFVPLEPFIEFFFPQDKVVEESETANKEGLARDDFDDAITKKFREFTGHIIRDFILDWYNTVSHDVEFVQQMFELFEHFFTQLRARVSRVQPRLFARLILLRLLRHHKSYKRALQMVRDRGVTSDDDEELVVGYEKLNGHLAMSNLPDSENDHHRALVVAVLKALLPRDYRLLGTALYLVRELIARNCVLDLVSTGSDPEWLNRAVVDLLGDGNSTCDDDDDDDNHQARTSPASVVKSESEPLFVMTSPPVDDPAPESSPSESISVEKDLRRAEPPSAPVLTQVEKSATIDCLSRLSPFEDLRITAATTTCEAYDSSKRYTLYKITYLARCESPTAKNQDDRQLRYQVNRRYREFVNLHERLLACDPLVKKSIKNIKGPSRSLPIGSNMDRDYVERRRIFLQDYLQNLCGIALVAHQSDFCQFLAYNYDPRIEFVGKKPNEFIPRFDRMFMSAVSEIRDLFNTTTTASNDDQQQQGNNGGGGVKKGGEVVEKIRKMVLGSRNKTDEHFRSVRRSFAGFESPRSADNSHHSVAPLNWIRPDLLLTPPPAATKVDRAVAPSSNDEAVDNQHLQIAACVCEALGEIWGIGLGERSVIYLMLGRYLDSFVLDNIASLTTPHRWLSYLQTLESSLWPDGKWNSGDDGKTKKSGKKKENAGGGSWKEEAVKTMKEFFPRSLITKLVGDDISYEVGVRDLVESFQNPTINRHLVYHIIDSLASLLFPDLTSLVTERDNIAL